MLGRRCVTAFVARCKMILMMPWEAKKYSAHCLRRLGHPDPVAIPGSKGKQHVLKLVLPYRLRGRQQVLKLMVGPGLISFIGQVCSLHWISSP